MQRKDNPGAVQRGSRWNLYRARLCAWWDIGKKAVGIRAVKWTYYHADGTVDRIYED